ncbi:hypothetical protein OG500_09530 [Kitasatospora sp. NBC_01250]|uniref:hypothetical protein n=1 Tax=Kitasatospora sp. NBC_01250 TaxID=2903571 RepID=UPI002E311F39|nr:hypothetical protein [Kitasatospora sp. NBC_01250]
MQNADVPPQDRSAGPAADRAPDLRTDLLRYAELGGFTLAADTHAWYAAAGTVTNPEEARAASTVLAEVRGGDLAVLQEAAERLAAEAALREPTTLAEVLTLLALLRRVQETAATLRSGAYEADLDALAAATANGSWRKERGLKISWGRRRKLRAEAKRLAVADRPRRESLHAALVAAATERTEWQTLAPAPGTTARPVDAELLEVTGQAAETLAGALRGLGRLLADRELTGLPFEELAALVDALAADEGTLYRLPELRTLRAGLEEGGLDDLLAELTAARADRSAVLLAYARTTGEAEAEDAAEAASALDADADADVEAEAEVDAEVEAAAEVAEAVVPHIAIPSPSPEPSAETIARTEVTVVEAPAVEESAIEAPVTEAAAEEVDAEEAEAADAAAEEPAAEEPVAEEPVVEEPAAEEPVAEELPSEPEPELTPEPEPTPVAAAESEPEPEAAPEPEPEPALEAAPEAVAAVEPAPAPAFESEPEPEPALEAAPEAVAAVEPAPASEPEPEAAPASAATPKRVRRPKKPDLAPGRPITAYSAEELLALVRWIDGDFVQRTDDELLRATMKELGFARLGPRIKEALGAAVAAARPTD